MKKLFTLFAAGLFLIACDKDDDPAPTTTPSTQNAIQLATDATFGDILTNRDGFTLYFFAPDADGDATCLDGCAAAWPAFFEENLTLDNGLEAGDFGTITRADGQSQNTYKGWPLYTFSNDTQPGEVDGDGAGGTWFVAKPDYTVMIVRNQLVGRDIDGNETNLTGAFEPGDEETFYMTDARGNTLYRFSNDENGVNNFTAPDFSNNAVWPIWTTDLLSVPSVFDINDFAVINVFGEEQLTYKGWPLYKFSSDQSRGDNFGVGFPQAGVWPTLNAGTEEAPGGSEIERVFEISNVGAAAYLFDFTEVQNPELELTRGMTYQFNVNSPGHPFFINSVNGTGSANAFNDGVTNNGTANGTIEFTVPTDSPDILFYNCEIHAGMNGRIRIVNEGETRTFDVINIGAAAYSFSGSGFTGEENTNFTFKKGETYTFNVTAPGHPFYINSSQGTGTGNAFNDGVTNNGTLDGTLTFTVPQSAPATLFYNCEFHGGMTGTISIID